MHHKCIPFYYHVLGAVQLIKYLQSNACDIIIILVNVARN